MISQAELILQRREWKRNGRRVVCAVGAFDLLHPGHVRRLEQARALGDVLVVAVQSDSGVRAAKPSEPGHAPRPINPAMERMEIVDALAAVDFVVEFDAASPAELVTSLSPDVLALGGAAGSSDTAWLEDEPGRSLAMQVVRIPFEPGFSTSLLLDRISQLNA